MNSVNLLTKKKKIIIKNNNALKNKFLKKFQKKTNKFIFVRYKYIFLKNTLVFEYKPNLNFLEVIIIDLKKKKIKNKSKNL